MKSVKEVVVAFLAIFCEMGRQMFLCAVTESQKWEEIQDTKLSDERKLGLEKEGETVE